VCCGLVGSAFKHDIIGRIAAAEPRVKQLFRLVRVLMPPGTAHAQNKSAHKRIHTHACTCLCTHMPFVVAAEPRVEQLFRHASHTFTCTRTSGARVLQVKLWAKMHGLNDGMNGTFNSWSLTLMVGKHGVVKPNFIQGMH